MHRAVLQPQLWAHLLQQLCGLLRQPFHVKRYLRSIQSVLYVPVKDNKKTRWLTRGNKSKPCAWCGCLIWICQPWFPQKEFPGSQESLFATKFVADFLSEAKLLIWVAWDRGLRLISKELIGIHRNRVEFWKSTSKFTHQSCLVSHTKEPESSTNFFYFSSWNPFWWIKHPTFNRAILIMGPYKPLRNWVDDHAQLETNLFHIRSCSLYHDRHIMPGMSFPASIEIMGITKIYNKKQLGQLEISRFFGTVKDFCQHLLGWRLVLQHK